MNKGINEGKNTHNQVLQHHICDCTSITCESTGGLKNTVVYVHLPRKHI